MAGFALLEAPSSSGERNLLKGERLELTPVMTWSIDTKRLNRVKPQHDGSSEARAVTEYVFLG